MIRQGRREGWLQLSEEAFKSWTLLHSVDFRYVKHGRIPGRGAALLAKEPITLSDGADQLTALMTVPKSLVLGLESIHEYAKFDRDFREVLDNLGDFGREPRGAILTFLLFQASISSLHLAEKVGVHGDFTDYAKSLPSESLPTFWEPAELQLLVGTTLAPAVGSKLKSLRREYELLCSSLSDTRWFRIVQEHLEFDDWLQVDSMYRSRALDFPGVGHCMVPCIDLANHAAGDEATAIYEVDAHGNPSLLLRPDQDLKVGQEVTITYGDEKGACEMIFSYGFLEESRQSAQTVFLSLTLPEYDPYRMVKMEIADCAPGVRLVDTGTNQVDWESDFVWLLCVGADDGLRFELARTVDETGEEMHGFFQGHELQGGARALYERLRQSENWDVYQLRAVTILQDRIFDQMKLLHETQDEAEAQAHGPGTDIRDDPYRLSIRLRKLEFDLLERAFEDFERQKVELSESEVVQRYLASMQEEDFS